MILNMDLTYGNVKLFKRFLNYLSRNFAVTNLSDHKLMFFVISISFFRLRNVVHTTGTLLTLL